MLQRRVGLLGALLVIAATGIALGQGRQTSIITGTITDTTNAVLPGVTVSLSSPDMIGGVHTAVTDAQGIYRFPSLFPGIYQLTAQLQGFRTIKKENVTLPVGQTVIVDFQLAVAAQATEITVTGTAPTVDTKSTQASTDLPNEILQNLPTGRFQPDIINLAPGVTANVAYGGTRSSNALWMDGVDVSDPEGGSPFAFFNYNWVKEVQIVGLGAPAEYGSSTGLIANSIVRSGSNRFEGLFETLFIRNSFLGDNRSSLSPALQKTFAPRFIKTFSDSTAQLGGPLLKDRLWFFTGFQYFKRVDRPAGFTGGFTSERDPRFIQKITWQASQNVRLNGFYEYDLFDVKGRLADNLHPPETTILEPSPESNFNGVLTWTINSKTLFDARLGGFTGYFPLEPTPPGSRKGPFPHVDLGTGKFSVNAPYFGRFDRTPIQLNVSVTRYADQFLGKSHEFKFGAEILHATSKNEYGYPGGRYYMDYFGEPYQVYLWDGYRAVATTKRVSGFAQDTWTVNNYVTLNPGVRFDVNRGNVRGPGIVYKTSPVAARLGAVLDILGDHSTVIRGHYGRYYDAPFAGAFESLDFGNLNPKTLADVLGPNNFSVVSVTPASRFSINPSVKQSFVDQYMLGAERAIGRDFSLKVNYVRRSFKNIQAYTDPPARYVTAQKLDPGPDGRLGTADDGGLVTVFNRLNPGDDLFFLTNPAGAVRRYNGIIFEGSKRFSHRWQMLSSYTYSRTRGKVSNSFGANSAATFNADVGTSGVFVDPNVGINSDGRVLYDYRHQLKLEGTVQTPDVWGVLGFNISVFYRVTSGQTWSPRTRIRGLNQGSERVRVEPRGTRRLQPIKRLDLRVEKYFRLPFGSRNNSLGFYADLFNATNQGAPNSEANRLAIDDRYGSTYLNPVRWVEPRTMRLGFRFSF